MKIGTMWIFLIAFALDGVGALVEDPARYEYDKAKVPEPVKAALLAGLANGDFADGLAGWVTEGTVSVMGEQAMLNDRNQPVSFLYQPVALLPGEYQIQFDVLNELAPNPGSGFFPDTFYASLYFTTNAASFSVTAGTYDSVLALLDMDANGLVPNVGSSGTSPLGDGWIRYTATFQNSFGYVVPVFELPDLDTTTGNSAVRIDNIVIVAEPWSVGLLGLGLGLLAYIRRQLPFVARGLAGVGPG